MSSMMSMQYPLADEAQTLSFGAKLATVLPIKEQRIMIYLQGELGAGKTCFSRGLIQGLGHSGGVKSPTYTLWEPYEIFGAEVNHFDLYRLSDAEELEYLGVREVFARPGLCLIEWPDRGHGFLPPADLLLELCYCQSGLSRELSISAKSPLGENVLQALQDNLARC